MGKRGFTFRGSTICYAFMQAVGIVDDHVSTCFPPKEINTGAISCRICYTRIVID